MGEREQWRGKMPDAPIKSCGRLDMATYMPDEVTVGRVTSDRVRYVYFEDGSECIVLGKLCDYVAFRAADYDARIAALEKVREAAWDACGRFESGVLPFRQAIIRLRAALDEAEGK